MMALLRFLFTLPFIIALVFFAVINRENVSVSFSPFHDPVDLPAYGLALGMLAAGFIIGALFSWMATLSLRWERRQQKRRIQKLESQLDAANENWIDEKTEKTRIS